MDKELLKWIKIVVLIGFAIVLLIGFTIGYLIGDDSCTQNPFTYGIKKLNEANDDKFFCSCASGKFPQPISFNEEGVKRTTSDQNWNLNHQMFPGFSKIQEQGVQ